MKLRVHMKFHFFLRDCEQSTNLQVGEDFVQFTVEKFSKQTVAVLGQLLETTLQNDLGNIAFICPDKILKSCLKRRLLWMPLAFSFLRSLRIRLC